MPAVWLSDINLSPVFWALFLGHVALACLVVAVSARWWSALVVAPLTSVLFLGSDEASFSDIFAVVNLIIGLPTAAVAAFLFRQTTDPPGWELEDSTRMGALVAAGIAILLVVLLMIAY